MKHSLIFVFGFILLFYATISHGQQTLISKKKIDLKTTTYWPEISENNRLSNNYAFLDSLNFYDITYLSDGLKIKSLIVEPKELKKLPVVIFNRGGNRDFSMITPETMVEWMAPIARHGYLMIASQYRGSTGSEGSDEFGGKDVDDILNLFPVIDNLPNADTSKVGMYGWSRGGMMTYIALTKTNRVKAAIIGGAPTDLFEELKIRPAMEKTYAVLMPGYLANKEEELKKRSVAYWPGKLCQTTALLIIHGKNDTRASYKPAEALAAQLNTLKYKCRFQLFENGDHIISQQRTLKDEQIVEWLKSNMK